MRQFGVHSEVGKLRSVMVCRPGLAHQRLTPGNCRDLLFDDVLWVHEAQKEVQRLEAVLKRLASVAAQGSIQKRPYVERDPLVISLALSRPIISAILNHLAARGAIEQRIAFYGADPVSIEMIRRLLGSLDFLEVFADNAILNHFAAIRIDRVCDIRVQLGPAVGVFRSA